MRLHVTVLIGGIGLTWAWTRLKIQHSTAPSALERSASRPPPWLQPLYQQSSALLCSAVECNGVEWSAVYCYKSATMDFFSSHRKWDMIWSDEMRADTSWSNAAPCNIECQSLFSLVWPPLVRSSSSFRWSVSVSLIPTSYTVVLFSPFFLFSWCLSLICILY